jgi:hypothetical protein
MIAALVVLLLIGFFLLFIVVVSSTGKQRKKALAGKDDRLAELFAGEPDTISYSATLVNLPAEVVIEEAHRRGYRVIADSQTQYGPRNLTFARDPR